MVEDIVIQQLPIVAPAVLVDKCSYGWSPKDLALKIVDVHTQVKLGLATTADIDKYTALGTQPSLSSSSSSSTSSSSSIACRTNIDITAILQARIDDACHNVVAGSELVLHESTNWNQICGDPCPGLPKFLALEYQLMGFGTSTLSRLGTINIDVCCHLGVNSSMNDVCPIGICCIYIYISLYRHIFMYICGTGESIHDNEVLKGGSTRNFALREAGKLKLPVNVEGFLATSVHVRTHEVRYAYVNDKIRFRDARKRNHDTDNDVEEEEAYTFSWDHL